MNLLTPGSLNDIIKHLDTQHDHSGYSYQPDADSFENEINEFFSYTDIQHKLKDYQRAFQKEYNSNHTYVQWINTPLIDKRNIVLSLIDKLSQEGHQTSQILVYISLGYFDKPIQKEKRVQLLIENNELLVSCHVLPVVFSRLEKTKDMDLSDKHAVEEIELYLTLLYLMIETQRYQALTSCEIKYTTFKTEFGGFENIKQSKEQRLKQIWTNVGYRPTDSTIKCSPQAMVAFQHDKMSTYPGYQALHLPFNTFSDTGVTTELIEPQKIHYAYAVPYSIQEADKVFQSHLYLSLVDYQRMQAKSIYFQGAYHSEETMNDLLERCYATMLNDLKHTLAVLLNLFLTSAAAIKNETGKTDDIKASDIKRDREIHLKSISAILLLLLKWTRSSHILKFESISHILVDAGYLLLTLRVIGSQEIMDSVKEQTDVEFYGFFTFDATKPFEKQAQKDTTNSRNLYWIINTLKTLHLLTKQKKHYTMLLVQYKSGHVLKRVFKIRHPTLEYYVLKLFKSQIPYFGRKWKHQNMKIISAIYLKCTTRLNEDWLSKADSKHDLETAKIEEKQMRLLTRLYHGYVSSHLPLHKYYFWSSIPYLDDNNDHTPIELNETIHKLFQEQFEAQFKPVYSPLKINKASLKEKKITPLARSTETDHFTYLTTLDPNLVMDTTWQINATQTLIAKLVETEELTITHYMKQIKHS
ncbi:uncharacterized protein B0P05DRAFT_583052 [Gilbertella persicaria]|uniref:uncharacterized protein n=1 Tax=Gilbertella persicaria TaxID=101096 RepID=UPI00221E5F25|nr:uncharacterized protein B0P05DRAFT_583052 [Gilbertella persicaria]KAI8098082.1 hypothetical protein B0P05DRAFT_583052 [Gilbertella persicaria]